MGRYLFSLTTFCDARESANVTIYIRLVQYPLRLAIITTTHYMKTGHSLRGVRSLEIVVRSASETEDDNGSVVFNPAITD